MSVEIFNHLFGGAFLGNTNDVLGHKSKSIILFQLFELAFRNFALGAEIGSFITFMNVTAYCTDKFFLHNVLVFWINY